MANPGHVALVRKGVYTIGEWRRAHPKERLDLSGADLSGTLLWPAYLRGANLSGANLTGANLSNVDLERANLSSADLSEANLIAAQLSEANLREAYLRGANLGRVKLYGANLRGANLYGANLSGANLYGANLYVANLHEANLNGANLSGTDLDGADLSGADLTGALLGFTSLGDLDLSQGRGLEAVEHLRPSTVGVNTLIRSIRGAGDSLPELMTFFRGAGVPEELLKEVPRIVAKVKYYSCFISYGQPNLEFATKLDKDLRARGVSCWTYEMDKKVGKRTWKEIGESRRGAERFVVLCSGAALVRDGLLKEIEEQIDEDPDKVVPISLDDLWKERGFRVQRVDRDLKPFLMERNYADFSNWDSDPARYGKALAELLKGLRRP